MIKLIKTGLTSFLLLSMLFGLHSQVHAQTTTGSGELNAIEIATDAANATDSAELATASASIEPTPVPRSEADITETTSQTQDALTQFLMKNTPENFNWFNPLQYGIRRAVENGVPLNILVLILLFPVITAIIAVSRHVVGMKGFGVYTPAVLSVAFLSTGIMNGILLFLVTLAASTIMKKVLKRLQLQYLPRTAMLLWGVSVFMILVLILISFFPFSSLLTIRIFPLLIIMLLTENFLESQLSGSQSEARQLTIETLIIAILCSVLIGLQPVQEFVLLRPELTLIAVAVLNLFVGRYTGLRLLEWLRFRDIIQT